MQDAYIGGVAAQIGASDGPLSDAYGDALALTTGEAMEQIFRINADRKVNRVMRR